MAFQKAKRVIKRESIIRLSQKNARKVLALPEQPA
jgi:uncharacterized protein (DUF1778 family)